jgi:hypothetical protein
MAAFDFLLSRRQLLRVGAVSTAVSMSGWLGKLAMAAEKSNTKPKRSCILLWMNGGPSTIDLWDLKPGHENGGPFKEIKTSAPGLMIGEHLPKMAKHGDRLAILRGMSTKEGDHARGTYLMRTGQLPSAAGIQYPSVGALISKELGDRKAELPNLSRRRGSSRRKRLAPASSARCMRRSWSATTAVSRTPRGT